MKQVINENSNFSLISFQFFKIVVCLKVVLSFVNLIFFKDLPP